MAELPTNSDLTELYIKLQLNIIEEANAAEIASRPQQIQGYDDIMGTAWQIDGIQGRKAANSFLLENGLRAIQEDDGK